MSAQGSRNNLLKSASTCPYSPAYAPNDKYGKVPTSRGERGVNTARRIGNYSDSTTKRYRSLRLLEFYKAVKSSVTLAYIRPFCFGWAFVLARHRGDRLIYVTICPTVRCRYHNHKAFPPTRTKGTVVNHCSYKTQQLQVDECRRLESEWSSHRWYGRRKRKSPL
jgi:hypothetical protein